MKELNWNEIEAKKELLGMTRRELASFLGVSEKTLNNWKNGRKIPETKRPIIEQFLLANTKDGIALSLDMPIVVDDESPYYPVNIPLVTQYAYGGYLVGFSDPEYVSALPKYPFMADREMTGNYIAFEVRGDSMDDGTKDAIQQGDIVFCREVEPYLWKDSKLHINKRDFVIVHKDGIVAKRIIEHDVAHHTIIIHSLNPDYADKTLNLADVRQIFSIVASQRQRKR